MKKVWAIGLSVLLLLTALPVGAVAAAMGDLNGDGRINNRDLGLMQQYLNEWDVSVNTDAADTYYDGKLNNRDLAVLQRYLNGWDVNLGPTAVQLPEIGYDLDGRGRIFVQDISVSGNTVTVTLINTSTKWITEETASVKYVCTDANGNVLTLPVSRYGTLYFGVLERGKTVTKSFTLPEGTVKVAFGAANIIYWTAWA